MSEYYLKNNRQWPVSMSMLVPEYLETPVIDPFGKENLKIFPFPGGLRIYSIGPDRADNRGNLIYHPANGLNSDGDIVMDIR